MGQERGDHNLIPDGCTILIHTMAMAAYSISDKVGTSLVIIVKFDYYQLDNSWHFFFLSSRIA
jgi:hypothetical protein